MTDGIIEELQALVGSENVWCNEPMNRHTSFKTGGNADCMVEPQDSMQLGALITLLKQKQTPFIIMGNGTNLLVSDDGIEGVVIKIGQKMSAVYADGAKIKIQAGALLCAVATQALSCSLTGFEFASGIPGTFGGAVCMNAGAYDGEMKDVLLSVEVLTQTGERKTIPAKDLSLGYRTSVVAKEGFIVIGGTILLNSGKQEDIKEKMADFAQRRREKQPLNFPSAGSTFKRPTGYFAGKLITDANLKGFCIGGAEVSQKHAGFVINKANATTSDILKVIEHCQTTVWEKFGVKLETEVKFVGRR